MSNNGMWQHPMPTNKKEIDYNQVRIQAATNIALGLATRGTNDCKDVAKKAVMLADALIEELQKKGGNDE